MNKQETFVMTEQEKAIVARGKLVEPIKTPEVVKEPEAQAPIKSELPLETTKSETKSLINVSDNVLVPTTHDQLYRSAQVYVKSGLLPKTFDTPEKVITGLQVTKELGLKPGIMALRNIYIVNGVPSIFGEYPLALVKASGLLLSIDEYCVDKDSNRICIENKNLTADIAASVCEVTRKGENKTVRTFLASEAPENAIWNKYFSIMMKRRVRSIALKDVFPDVLVGISIAEYDHDAIVVDGKLEGTVEQTTTTNDLNDRFKSK